MAVVMIVCGEPCETQKCVICIPKGRQADIVDFILQRPLSDIDLASNDIGERLIALACSHIFTVETLDGHCNMQEYYHVDEMGRFLCTKAPPVNYQTPPTCPTCRGPISALRYGRVTKRATLDILEQNVAGTMSRALEACTPAIAEFTATMSASQEQVKKLQFKVADEEKPPKPKEPGSYADLNGPLPAEAFDVNGMQTAHGIILEEARAWNEVVKPIMREYRAIVTIATTRGAHVKAYEAALNTLYRLELQELANDPTRATDAPEPLALAIVDHKIGQPPPKADVRFQIEAYFLLLEIRAVIAQLAQARVESLPLAATQDDPDAVQHRARWTSYVSFLYQSCVTDAQKAGALAQESSAARQVVRASVHKLRFRFEQSRWETTCERAELVRTDAFDVAARDRLVKKVNTFKLLMLQESTHIRGEYLRALPSTLSLEDQHEAQKWLTENCPKKVATWESECDALKDFVVKGGVYQPLSTQELEDIVRSFNFSASCRPHILPPQCSRSVRAAHRGHFYNCQNGHTFVITEVRLTDYFTSESFLIRRPTQFSAAERWRGLAVLNARHLLEAPIIQSTHRTRATRS